MRQQLALLTNVSTEGWLSTLQAAHRVWPTRLHLTARPRLTSRRIRAGGNRAHGLLEDEGFGQPKPASG